MAFRHIDTGPDHSTQSGEEILDRLYEALHDAACGATVLGQPQELPLAQIVALGFTIAIPEMVKAVKQLERIATALEELASNREE